MKLTTNRVMMTPDEIKNYWTSGAKARKIETGYISDTYVKKKLEKLEKTNYADKKADINKAPASKEKDFNKTVGLIGNSPETAQEGQVGVMPQATSTPQKTQTINPQKSSPFLF